MKFLLFIFCSFFIFFETSAQNKIPLTHDVYDDWKSVRSHQISNDGNWIMYEINPQEGDGTLEIQDLKSNQTINFARGKSARFAYDNAYLFFKVKPYFDETFKAKKAKKKPDEMPKDSLVILNLKNKSTEKIARVKSYKIPAKGNNWMAYLLEKPLKEKPKKDTSAVENDSTKTEKTKEKKPYKNFNILVLKQLNGKNEYKFEKVKSYFFSENGSMFYFEIKAEKKDTIDVNGIYAFDLKTQTKTLIDTGKTFYKQLACSKTGNNFAFLASADSLEAEHHFYSLFHWAKSNSKTNKLIDTLDKNLPENWTVSSNRNLSFSENENRLFFGTAPRPVKLDYESDTTILDAERVKLDIWSWTDDHLQPMQLLNAKQEAKKSYLALYDFQQNKMIQLADEELENISLDRKRKLNLAIARTDKPYRKLLSWDYPIASDVYLIDLKDGSRKNVFKDKKGYARISPAGKYVYWFDRADTNWMAYEIATGKKIQLTNNITVNFFDDEDDHPMPAYAFGSAGWTENDESIWIYDKYDIWEIDPKNPSSAKVLTNGRNQEMEFRYTNLDFEQEFINPEKTVYLSAFNQKTKASGYYQIHSKKGLNKLIMEDFEIYRLRKAKNSNRVLYTKESFQKYPDVWTSKLDFKNQKQLSNANPQQKNYLWGTCELVNWTAYDGTKLQGLLYKPENFDPNKKYPMMVYFYEKNSDALHYYNSPAPSASIINKSYFVSNGYLVFVPDIVYQIGHPGKSAENCILSGTEAMVKKGFVDEKNMAIQGQSWGGYQVAHLVTRTNMFKAAMAGAPVSNMFSAYGGIRWGSGMSRMFQYENTQSRIGGTIWDSFDLYKENSPVFFADKVETPLLMMHNDDDGAVPWYQGIEYFVALRRLSKPVWMLVYNGEAHNLMKRYNRKDLSIRMSQFFDHYLKNEPAPPWMKNGLPAVKKGKTMGYE